MPGLPPRRPLPDCGTEAEEPSCDKGPRISCRSCGLCLCRWFQDVFPAWGRPGKRLKTLTGAFLSACRKNRPCPGFSPPLYRMRKAWPPLRAPRAAAAYRLCLIPGIQTPASPLAVPPPEDRRRQREIQQRQRLPVSVRGARGNGGSLDGACEPSAAERFP